MTSSFVMAAVFFVLFLGLMALFAYGVSEGSAGAGVCGFVFGAIFLLAFISVFQNAVYVETTCSTQGLHTVAGKCVELIEVE